jgi:hypothetical protein
MRTSEGLISAKQLHSRTTLRLRSGSGRSLSGVEAVPLSGVEAQHCIYQVETHCMRLSTAALVVPSKFDQVKKRQVKHGKTRNRGRKSDVGRFVARRAKDKKRGTARTVPKNRRPLEISSREPLWVLMSLSGQPGKTLAVFIGYSFPLRHSGCGRQLRLPPGREIPRPEEAEVRRRPGQNGR